MLIWPQLWPSLLQPAVASGATAAICSSIARVLDELPGGDRTQVGCAGHQVLLLWVFGCPCRLLLDGSHSPPHPSPSVSASQVCVATFDSTIHFYSLRPGQAQPHMLVVPDTTDVYCPLAGNVVVNLKQSRELVSGCCGLVSCGSWGCCVWVHPGLSEAAGFDGPLCCCPSGCVLR